MAACVASVILLLLSCSCSVWAGSAPSSLVPTVKYQVDLDQPPMERWRPILKDFTGSVPLVLEYFRSIVRARAAATPLPVVMCTDTARLYAQPSYLVVPERKRAAAKV